MLPGTEASSAFSIRPVQDADCQWAAGFLRERWGAALVVVHQTIYYTQDLAGLLAWDGEARVGLITYHIERQSCEIVTLDSVRPRQGIGDALVKGVCQVAQDAGCRRLWLITTNDNTGALRFYQRRGFHLAALYPGAVENARRRKPEILLTGEDGISIRDEIELELEYRAPRGGID